MGTSLLVNRLCSELATGTGGTSTDVSTASDVNLRSSHIFVVGVDPSGTSHVAAC